MSRIGNQTQTPVLIALVRQPDYVSQLFLTRRSFRYIRKIRPRKYFCATQ